MRAHCDLTLHFLVDDGSECLFMWVFAILFGEVSVHVLLISNWIFFFLLLSFASFFKKYILGTSPFFIFFIYLLYVFFGHVACGILVP